MIANPDEQNRRRAICQACPFKNLSGGGAIAWCGKCGCLIAAKVKLNGAKCPESKW